MRFVYLTFFIVLMACDPLSQNDLSKKTLDLESQYFSNAILKETSRDFRLKKDPNQIKRVIFIFNQRVDFVEFSLSCLMRKDGGEPQEMFSTESIGFPLGHRSIHIPTISFEIPVDWMIGLHMTEKYKYVDKDNVERQESCVEILKTGDYFFYAAGADLFEVEVNGNFYMYMQKQNVSNLTQ